MYTRDVTLQIHEAFLINKEPLGKQNNPHYNAGAREVALNLAIRGNSREDGNGYITIVRSNKNTFKKLPKKNTKAPKAEPTMTVEELVMTMQNYIYTDEEGEVFHPEIYDYFVYAKILTSDLDNSTPVDLVQSIKPAKYSTPLLEEDYEGEDYQAYYSSFVPDELEPERQMTWREWGKVDSPTVNLTVIDDYTYLLPHVAKTDTEIIRGKEVQTTGHPLTGSELMVIYNSLDAELVD